MNNVSLPCSRWIKYLENYCGLALLTSVQLLTYLGFILCCCKSNGLWDLGFDFFIPLLPSLLLHKYYTIPLIFNCFLALYLSMFMTASPGLESWLVITYVPVKHDTNKWFCKKSCSTKHGKKHKACDTVSFPLAVIVLLFVLSYTTWPHHPLLWLLKKQNCSSMSQEESEWF